MGKKSKWALIGSIACIVVGVAAAVWPPLAPFALPIITVIGGATGTGMITHAVQDSKFTVYDPAKAGK